MVEQRVLIPRVGGSSPSSLARHEVQCFMITKLPLDAKNRMLRIGFGKHDSRWFFRVDLWFVGFRFSPM
jgi:hypothetical protein